MALTNLLEWQRWNSDYAEWQAFFIIIIIFYGYDSWRQISVYNDRFVF